MIKKKSEYHKINCENPITKEKLPVLLQILFLITMEKGPYLAVQLMMSEIMNLQKNINIPIKKVIECLDNQLPFNGDGKLINSPLLDGLSKNQAIEKIINYFETEKIGQQKINYKIRDWGVSRQRYWGCPIPAIYYEDGTYRILDKDELPVVLPYDVNLEGKGMPYLIMIAGEKLFVQKQTNLLLGKLIL